VTCQHSREGVEGEEGKASPPFVSQPYGSDVEGRIGKERFDVGECEIRIRWSTPFPWQAVRKGYSVRWHNIIIAIVSKMSLEVVAPRDQMVEEDFSDSVVMVKTWPIFRVDFPSLHVPGHVMIGPPRPHSTFYSNKFEVDRLLCNKKEFSGLALEMSRNGV
jgi:hypothetical protein